MVYFPFLGTAPFKRFQSDRFMRGILYLPPRAYYIL